MTHHQRPFDTRVQVVLDAMTQVTSRQRSIEDLARLVSLSPSRLTHLFRCETGDSISNVISTARLREAARLLEFADEPILPDRSGGRIRLTVLLLPPVPGAIRNVTPRLQAVHSRPQLSTTVHDHVRAAVTPTTWVDRLLLRMPT